MMQAEPMVIHSNGKSVAVAKTRLDQIVNEINGCNKRIGLEIVVIGQRLIEAREICPHGEWEDWIEENLKISDRTARNFMNVAERFAGKTEIISQIPPTVLYALAAPSTSEEAVDDVLFRASQGEKFTVSSVKQVIEDHTDIVKRAVRSGVKVAETIIATQGFVAIGGENVAISAALTEDMAETQDRQTQHIIDSVKRKAGIVPPGTTIRRSFDVRGVIVAKEGRCTFIVPSADDIAMLMHEHPDMQIAITITYEVPPEQEQS